MAFTPPSRKPLPAPPGLHPDLARLVESLARQAARDDYERRRGQENDEEAAQTALPTSERLLDL